jgi:hypothetical protein
MAPSHMPLSTPARFTRSRTGATLPLARTRPSTTIRRATAGMAQMPAATDIRRPPPVPFAIPAQNATSAPGRITNTAGKPRHIEPFGVRRSAADGDRGE